MEKTRSDTCFTAAFFCCPGRARVCPSVGNFSVMALMLVLWEALDLGGVDTLRCGYLGEVFLGGVGSGRR